MFLTLLNMSIKQHKSLFHCKMIKNRSVPWDYCEDSVEYSSTRMNEIGSSLEVSQNIGSQGWHPGLVG